MAEDADFETSAEPSLQQLASFHAEEVMAPKHMKRIENAVSNGVAEGATIAQGVAVATAEFLAKKCGDYLEKTESLIEPVIGPFLSRIAGHLVGVEASTSDLLKSAAGGGDTDIGAAMARIAFSLLAPPEGELKPGREGADKLVKTMSQMVFNGWFEATAFEMLASLFPNLDSFESVAELPDKLIGALGLGRLSRTALRPLAHLLIATPLEWQLHKEHRPTLFSAAEAIELNQRSGFSDEQLQEELARQGYSDLRIAGLRLLRGKYTSLDDALTLVRNGIVDRSIAVQALLNQGWDQTTADQVVTARELARQESIMDDAFGAVRTAYVDRRIGDSELSGYLPAIFASDTDRAAHELTLRTMRALNTKRLSPGEARSCVKASVLPIAAYREALRLDGYNEEAVLSLELLLETEINKDADVEQLRKQKEAEREAEKQARIDAAAKRAAEIEQQRAQQRRGPLAALARAVVRGLIPIDRYVEVLTPQYDSDTVGILRAQVEQDRADYLAQQKAAADAAKRAALKHLDVGALQAAYVDNVLSLDRVRQQLDAIGFAPEDADVLIATMQARKADLDAAKQQRADAAKRAAVKSIDLARLETLVRRGHRSLSDYTALLASLGFDDAARAGMVELLQLQIADDQKARTARDAAAAANAAQGLSLEQIRRAVILGISTVDEFQRWLVQHKFTIDAQAVLVAELRDDVAQAEAARAKRSTGDGSRGGTVLPLATIARAARLGIITPDAYLQRLVAAGYTPDDIAIEMDLLTVEIADVAAANARKQAAEQKTTDHGLSLDQLAKAVKLDEASIDDYRARAVALGYAADDVDTLVSVLTDEVQTFREAAARHTTIDGQLKARNLSLGELDAAVKAGKLSLDDYAARLQSFGFGADDAELLTQLLALKVVSPPGGP